MINILNKNKTYITNKGFTLAEVLITLGIIGVVAAMTIPVLTAKYRQSVCISQLKKMYSVMSQAMLFTVQKEGDYSSLFNIVDVNSQSIQNWYTQNLKPYIKITNECFDKAGCWADSGTKLMNGGTPNWDRGNIGIGQNIVIFDTVDGYSVSIDACADSGRFWGVNISSTQYVVLYVDVNGKKGPNVIGKDTFVFVFSDRGFVPAGRDKTDEEVNADCSKNGTGYFCFEKIIRNGWQIDKENLW